MCICYMYIISAHVYIHTHVRLCIDLNSNVSTCLWNGLSISHKSLVGFFRIQPLFEVPFTTQRCSSSPCCRWKCNMTAGNSGIGLIYKSHDGHQASRSGINTINKAFSPLTPGQQHVRVCAHAFMGEYVRISLYIYTYIYVHIHSYVYTYICIINACDKLLTDVAQLAWHSPRRRYGSATQPAMRRATWLGHVGFSGAWTCMYIHMSTYLCTYIYIYVYVHNV